MKLLEKWPVDKRKTGRDLGEHLRNQLKAVINPTDVTTKVSDNLQKQTESLERLANNVYANKYKRSLTSTATGLTAEQCSQVLSSEFLAYLNDERGFFSKDK